MRLQAVFAGRGDIEAVPVEDVAALLHHVFAVLDAQQTSAVTYLAEKFDLFGECGKRGAHWLLLVIVASASSTA